MNILVAIRRVATAWSMFKAETIKCFVLDSASDVATRDYGEEEEEEGPFLAADPCVALQGLIDQAMRDRDRCTLEEHVNRDNDLLVFTDHDSDSYKCIGRHFYIPQW